MKAQLIFLPTLIFSSLAFAEVRTPTSAICRAPGVTFSYLRFGPADGPVADYRGPGLIEGDEDLNVNKAFDSDSISRSNTSTGTVVNIAHADSVSDAGTMDLALILPQVNFQSGETEIVIDTLLLRTKHKTSFRGLSGVKGALSETLATPVKCTVRG